VDWGILWFLTKPFFYALSFFGELTGNFGVAILIVTLIVRILLFPLANKSFASMAKMRKVQPEIKRIQERFKDDRAKMQQEMMAFYKREKVNPFSGCLLLLPQLPIFFAFYKVLFVTIEMRHAPFFGWIEDLSAPDPTSWVNLFGLLPFSSEPFTAIPLVGMVFAIGAWPMIMGITMWFNQLLNPQPTDPMQARIMAFLPVIFTVIFATFAAGLVIYWTWTNMLAVAQQYVIMRRMGVKPDIVGNLPFVGRKASQESAE
jgi:YidC/Oxa1 family membrane protein insertase